MPLGSSTQDSRGDDGGSGGGVAEGGGCSSSCSGTGENINLREVISIDRPLETGAAAPPATRKAMSRICIQNIARYLLY